MYIIKRADIAHAEKIRDIEKKSTDTPWTLKMISEDLESEGAFVCVAISEENREIIGHIGMKIILDEGHIHTVCVMEEHRRNGIGKLMMNYLIEEGQKLSLSQLFLEVRGSNIPAIRLYESTGFKLVGERKNFYKNPTEPALLMTYFYK